jgi:hypothetical protein
LVLVSSEIQPTTSEAVSVNRSIISSLASAMSNSSGSMVASPEYLTYLQQQFELAKRCYQYQMSQLIEYQMRQIAAALQPRHRLVSPGQQSVLISSSSSFSSHEASKTNLITPINNTTTGSTPISSTSIFYRLTSSSLGSLRIIDDRNSPQPSSSISDNKFS